MNKTIQPEPYQSQSSNVASFSARYLARLRVKDFTEGYALLLIEIKTCTNF
jgi:hypothetical protein